MKECFTCKVLKPEEQFSWRKVNVKRLGICKECHKEYRQTHYQNNKDKYIEKAGNWNKNNRDRYARRGITKEDFDKLCSKYDGLCWCCQARKAVVVDHDHSCCDGSYYKDCGKCVRGVLCHGCNVGIGSLGDSLESLQKAVKYLSHKHKK